MLKKLFGKKAVQPTSTDQLTEDDFDNLLDACANVSTGPIHEAVGVDVEEVPGTPKPGTSRPHTSRDGA